MTIKLHPHQVTAIEKMHNGCVLWGGVGTGKTITALAYSQMREADKKIVVVTTAKKRDTGDWEDEAGLLRIHPDKLEVTSWNKINDYIDREGCFFIFDEQRLVGTGSWVKSFYKIAKRNHWVLLSATPGDTWSDYAPMFIANGWYKNITEFRQKHIEWDRYAKFPKIKRYHDVHHLEAQRDLLLVEMPMIRHTTRHMHYVECEYNKDKLDIVRKKRWNVYEDKPLKNAAELFGVMRKVVSTHISRRDQLVRLIHEHPKLIVFYNYNYELEIMRELLSSIQANGLSTQTWEHTKSGLIIPSSTLSSTKEDSSLDLPPWDLIPEEIASGQLTTTRFLATPKTFESQTRESNSTSLQTNHTLREDTTRSWESKEQSTSSETNLSQAFANALQSEQQSRKTKSKPDDAKSESPLFISKSSVASADQWLTSNEKSTPGSTSLSLDIPKNGLTGSFGWAEWNGHKHQPIPETDRWVYLVQYASGSEGWNCVETDAMAFWSLTYSWKQFNQAQGRIDRLNTPFNDLHYYAFMTKSPADMPVLRALEAKHDFQPSKTVRF